MFWINYLLFQYGSEKLIVWIFTLLHLICSQRTISMRYPFSDFWLHLVLFIILTCNSASLAQLPQPPPNIGHESVKNNPPGGGAPIVEGVFYLSAWRVYTVGKKFMISESRFKVNNHRRLHRFYKFRFLTKWFILKTGSITTVHFSFTFANRFCSDFSFWNRNYWSDIP